MYLEGRREYKSIGLSGLLHSIMTLVVELSSLVFKTYPKFTSVGLSRFVAHPMFMKWENFDALNYCDL